MDLSIGTVGLADKVRARALRAVDVADAFLDRARHEGSALNAFLAIDEAKLRADAEELDARLARGEDPGPLAGVPIAIKDALCTRGLATTAASRILEGYLPPYDATVVTRLRAAGALIAGKTNMDEFAMGSSTENSGYGPAKNPWDLTRTPGGSSGGSAAAVAARITFAALGSDTGGSIRQPAALTGVVGVKPSYGRVSRFGLIAFASTLDQVGPIATDVRGAARVLDAIAGHDPRDATSLRAAHEPGGYETACDRGIRGLRLGVPAEYFAKGLDPEVESSVRAAIAHLEANGCTVKPVTLPHTRLAVATYYVVATAEASSNLARFDGVRFGLRSLPKGGDIAAMYGATRDQGFGREVKRRILLGTYVLSAGYFDAYYLKAQKVRALIKRDFDIAFAEVDAIVSPTAPTAAFKLGEKTEDPLAMYLNDIYTLPASLAGICGISVPSMPTKSGLPVGLQIVAPSLKEETLFALARVAEEHAKQHTNIPTIARS